MRLFFAGLTVGAVGIGYAYTQQVAVPAAESRTTTSRHLFDWQSADDTLNVASGDVATKHDEPPLVVRDTINATRTEITSVLDEFVRVNAEVAPASNPPDIVSQANGSGIAASDTELVPFATSDDRTSTDSPRTDPADASAVVNDIEPSIEAAKKEPKAPPGKPAITDATMITTKPAAKTEPEVATKPKTELLPGATSEKLDLVDPEWKVIGKTTNGLPMHSRRFGRQGTRTLVTAGLDGMDLVGTRWNDELTSVLLRRKDLLQTIEVLVLRAGNPDGLVKKVSTNAHGVLINRNFPSRRYQFLTDDSAGPGPASEAETHVIMQAFYSFRPRRVIHLTSTTGRSTVIYNRAAKDIAEQLQKQFQMTIQPLDVEIAPGSVEDFADGTLDAAVISLKLNAGTGWQKAWEKHLPAVMAAIQGQVTVNTGLKDELARSSPEVEGTRIPNADKEPQPPKKQRRGYEELPPPPR